MGKLLGGNDNILFSGAIVQGSHRSRNRYGHGLQTSCAKTPVAPQ
jgi:hypothetical protein